VLVKADWAQFGETVERPQLRVLLDGNRLTTFFVPLRYVSVHEGKDAAEELAGEAIIASTLEGSGLHVLTMPEMSKFVIAHTDEAKLMGSEAVDGIECQKFEVVYSGLKLHMWLGPVENPLLRQLSETTVISQDEKSKLTSSRISKLSWVTDRQIPDHEFQLNLPENSRRVDNILQALSEVQKQSPVGKPAPEIALVNTQGKAVKPAEWKGRKVTLVFWASWMNNPETALQYASKLNADTKADEAIYLVNVGETPDKISELLKQVSGLPENLFDQDDDLAIELRLNGIPSVVEIDATGIIRKISNTFDSK
jgi:thiol-disulfide isomerase/thioredoxin